jgi:hypothetical protein
MSQTMSITQALAELKLLDKRLRKFYEKNYDYECDASKEPMNWLAVRSKTTPVDEEALRRTAMAEWQSFMDLVARRDKMKRAIVLSNATTRVRIGDWEGTVAEAIEHKSSLTYKETMLNTAKSYVKRMESEFQRKQEQLQERLDKLLSSELGKDVRTNPDTIQAISVSFRENNKVELVDPLNVREKLRDLEREVEDFKTNVDWVLSETNGRTMITI